METIEIINITAFGAVVKSLLLLLLKPEDLMNKEYVDQMIAKHSYGIKDASVYEHVRSFVSFIYNDKFDPILLKNSKIGAILFKLEYLKQEILTLHSQEIEVIAQSGEYSRVYDIYAKLESMILQLLRLRMVIQPEFQFSKNVHPVSKIAYIAAKGFWLEDNGKKVRCITKSLGREDEYDGGKNDPKATETARERIREELYKKYTEIYPE